jgi:hypothetical protein
MKEEELIRKLESINFPRIEVESHRRRLRMALLQSQYFEEQPGKVVALKSRLKGGIDTMKGLFSWRPAWKPALVGTLAVALVVGSALFVPSLFGPSPEVLAAEIAQNSPEVQELLGDDLITVKKVQLVDGLGHVVCEASVGTFALAEVDLEKKDLVKVESIKMPELTDAEKERAVEIAKADPEVQELLDKGAEIDKVFPMFGMIALTEGNGETKIETSVTVAVALTLDDEKWIVHVNLEEEKVERIEDRRKDWAGAAVSGYEGGEMGKIEINGAPVPPVTEGERVEVIAIAKADPEVQKLLDKGAEINENIMLWSYKGSIASQDEDKITLGEASRDKAKLILELKENGEVVKSWIVTVDLDTEKVVGVEPMLVAQRAYTITLRP